MAGWKMSNDKLISPGGFYGEDKVKGQMFSHKYGFELMQNCDLPPPLKVFTGPEKTILSPINRVYSTISQEEKGREMELSDYSSSETEREKLELLKALRLSQTRAREAEKKLDVLTKERDALSKFLIQESLQLFAYKQWVKLMEFQISKLERQRRQLEPGYCKGSIWDVTAVEDEGDQKGSKSMTWFVAVALCLGIAGFGFAFGYRYIL